MDEQMKQTIVIDRRNREMQAIAELNALCDDLRKRLEVDLIFEPIIDNGVIKARVRAQSMT